MAIRRRKLEEAAFERLAGGLVNFLAARGIKPMSITITAFVLAIISSMFYYLAGSKSLYYYPAALSLAISGLFDALDGAVARKIGLVSDLGAFLDSVLDKLGECVIYIAIISSGAVSPFWGSLALASSIMVSYVRHRAEPLKIELKGIGFMERAERLIFLIVASIFAPFYEKVLEVTIILIGVLASLTTAWRIMQAAQILRPRARS